jgi:hypothetical protein
MVRRFVKCLGKAHLATDHTPAGADPTADPGGQALITPAPSVVGTI